MSADLEAVARRRLRATGLDEPRFGTAEEVVRWFGAYQGQDDATAKWGLAQRLSEPRRSADIESEFDSGRLVRTHVLRPTWHFVAVDDLPWLLDLTAERIRPKLRYYDKQLGLDDELITRAKPMALRALESDGALNRSQLAAVLAAEGIGTTGASMSHIMFHAELDGAVCSGPRAGRHHTYLPLAQRLSDAGLRPYAPGSREEGLARLVRMFLRSHGPATAKDFVWWSGLTGRDFTAGLAGLDDVERETHDGLTFVALPGEAARETRRVRLLQAWDEYTVAHTEGRTPILLKAPTSKPGMTATWLHTVIEGTQVGGHWKYSTAKGAVTLDARTFGAPTEALAAGIEAEGQALAGYLGLELGEVTVTEFHG
ncbi:winged helix DNA-binding domain-containing protein [Spongisporangium articulatum]|uniref:Winged helix DNA-binding domain-containing protein n=1 Tax=Spongisporangium articulatum TaxID=3362603 RepID=A0ABW8AK40_9ACTN